MQTLARTRTIGHHPFALASYSGYSTTRDWVAKELRAWRNLRAIGTHRIYRIVVYLPADSDAGRPTLAARRYVLTSNALKRRSVTGPITIA